MAKDSDLLKDAQDAFKRISDAESKNRDAWIDDMRFARLGDQWPAAVKRQRELEGRPCLTINRLPAFIRQVTNDARQNSPSIKCHPVGDGADKETAEILNGLIRNIEYTSDADVAYDTALEHAVSGGFGYFRISTDYACEDSFDQDIKIERIANPLTVYGDLDSTAADSSDWNKAFITDLWEEEDFKKQWPGAERTSFEANSHDKNHQWFADDMIRVAEWWSREEVAAKLLRLTDGAVMFEEEYLKIKDFLDVQGVTVKDVRPTRSYKVTQRIITGGEVLETNKWAGKYIPIVPVYGDEVMLDGQRHFLSLVRFARDPQQMFNFWRTASTELVALAPRMPFIGPKGAFNSDADKWATANTVSHPYIEYDGAIPPQRQPFAGPPAGALQEALNASDDMKAIMGIYDASLGAKSNETSGRAIMARQREGDVSTFNFIDNLSRAIRHAGRIMVDLIPKVYNTERMIRVIHEDGTNDHIQIHPNAPQVSPEVEQMQQEMQGIERVYNLTTGKYDVTCESGPSFTTKREEASNQMIEFIRAYPQAAGIVGDLLAKNLDWPGADEIANRMQAMLPPQIQGQNPQVEQMQQQLQTQDQHAKQAVSALQGQINQLQQKLQTAEDKANYEFEKLQIEKYKAETGRIEALTAAQAARIELAQEAVAQMAQMPMVDNATIGGNIAAHMPPIQPEQQQPPQGGFFTPQQPGQQPAAPV
jgi:hypothetical protein